MCYKSFLSFFLLLMYKKFLPGNRIRTQVKTTKRVPIVRLTNITYSGLPERQPELLVGVSVVEAELPVGQQLLLLV